jgi:hypothetical protein
MGGSHIMPSQIREPHFSRWERAVMLAGFAACILLSWLLVLRLIRLFSDI